MIKEFYKGLMKKPSQSGKLIIFTRIGLPIPNLPQFEVSASQNSVRNGNNYLHSSNFISFMSLMWR